jgi:multiple sugar transport system substrate-binding protein
LIYYVAKNSPTRDAGDGLAYHADWPVGPVGKPTQLHQLFRRWCSSTPSIERGEEYLRFMMEKEQYVAWQSASLGYVMQSLQGLRGRPGGPTNRRRWRFGSWQMRRALRRQARYASAGALPTSSLSTWWPEGRPEQRQRRKQRNAAKRAERYYKL